MTLSDKICNPISTLLFFIPVLSFLSTVNLPQILISDIYLIILSQIFILTVVFLISLVFHKIVFKHYLNFKTFFLINAFTIYLLFFYKNFKTLLQVLQKK